MAINYYTADNNNAFANLVGTLLGGVLLDKELDLGIFGKKDPTKKTDTTATTSAAPQTPSLPFESDKKEKGPDSELVGVVQMADQVNRAVKDPSSMVPGPMKAMKKKSALGAAILPKTKPVQNPVPNPVEGVLPAINPMQRRANAISQDPASKIMAGIKALDDPSVPATAKGPIAEKLLIAKHFKMKKGG